MTQQLKDSGERREFASGAVRDRGGDKPRPDLISPHAQMREGMIMTLGGKKYKLRNWELGINISECVASAQRHIEQYKRGDTDEDHIAQARWNLGAIIHYEEEIKAGRMDPAIDDMPKYVQQPNKSAWRNATPEDDDEFAKKAKALLTLTHFEAPPDVIRKVIERTRKEISIPADFCHYCGASIPPRYGEGTCNLCPPVVTFYITGPMRGLPFYNFPAFDGARDLGESLGYDIISPADLDREYGIDPIEDPGSFERAKAENPDIVQVIVRRDIEAILDLDPKDGSGLAVLPDWQNSIGASAEIGLAKFKGLKLVDARDFKTIIEV